jgi:tripartite-type tricarboxylate transporter receptor subunit TctC
VVTSEYGSGSDFVARLIAQELTTRWEKQLIVDNRGGSALILAGIMSKAPPDGYTLLVFGSTFWLTPLMRDHSTYDPVKDFAPITLVVNSPSILVIHASVPANSVKELIDLAKAKPGVLNYGSGANGAPTQLSVELFKAMAGVDIVRIPYKGTGPAVNALLGGQVQLMITGPAAVAPHVKSGKLKALAVASAQPSQLTPGLPTVAASGLPGYESASTGGVFAPARTPLSIVNQLHQEIVRIINRPDVKAKFLNAGLETVGNTPQEFAAMVKADMVKWGKVIKDAGIRED